MASPRTFRRMGAALLAGGLATTMPLAGQVAAAAATHRDARAPRLAAAAAPRLVVLSTAGTSGRLTGPVIDSNGTVFVVRGDAAVLLQDGSALAPQPVFTVATDLGGGAAIGNFSDQLPLLPVLGGDGVIVADTNTTAFNSELVLLRGDGTVLGHFTPGQDEFGSPVEILRHAIAFPTDALDGRKRREPPALADRKTVVIFGEQATAGGEEFRRVLDVIFGSAPQVVPSNLDELGAPAFSIPDLIPANLAAFTFAVEAEPEPVFEITVDFIHPAPPSTPGATSSRLDFPPVVLLAPYEVESEQNVYFFFDVPATGGGLPPGTEVTGYEQIVPGKRLLHGLVSLDNFSTGLGIFVDPELHSLPTTTDISQADFNGDGTVSDSEAELFLALVTAPPVVPGPRLSDDAVADVNGDGLANEEDMRIVLGVHSFQLSPPSPEDQTAPRFYPLVLTSRPLPFEPGLNVDFITQLRGNGLGTTFFLMKCSTEASPFEPIDVLSRLDKNGFSIVLQSGVDYGDGVINSIGETRTISDGLSNVNALGQVAVVVNVGGVPGVYVVEGENLPPPDGGSSVGSEALQILY